MTEIDEMVNKYVNSIQIESNKIKNKLIIDDIFDIARGVFDTYDVYVQYKQRMINFAREANERQITIDEDKYIFTNTIEPVIITKDDFDYIVGKYLHKLRW